MINLGFAETFLKSLEKLSRQDRATVSVSLMGFMSEPRAPGYRLHGLNMREKRFYSISPNMDLRVILLRHAGDYYHAVYVGHHDEAYRWAERRQVEIHGKTGAAQIVEFEEVIREEIQYVPRRVEVPPLFADAEDDYLLSLGVPPSWLETVKKLDEDGLYQVIDRLPEEAAEALIALASNEQPLPTSPSEPGTDPFEHPDAKRRFWVTSDETELLRALDAPWERWSIFLHPAQRDAVSRNFYGPARISGGAGTGKTIVALHRAVDLASKSRTARVLLVTYSQPLVRELEKNLNILAGSTGEIRARIAVKHLHSFAHDLAKQRDRFGFAPVRPVELNGYIKKAMREHPDVEISDGFLRAEFDAVIDYWGIRKWEDYRDIQRIGRGTPLSPSQRQAVWSIFESVLQQMREARRMTFSDLAEAARLNVEATGAPPFHHVVADEAQDFGPRELRLAMALASVGDDSHFFTGDVGQRIYRYPFSWVQAGVDVRGRGLRLYVNYRTTDQIKRFADRALGILPTADEDEQIDRSSISLLSGPDPSITGYRDGNDETSALAKWLEELVKNGIAPGEIAVLGRTNDLLDERAVPAIIAAGLMPRPLASNPSGDDRKVAVGTFHASKGLEFRAVSLVGSEAGILPHPAALAAADDKKGEAIATTRERQLFYVGCTRARDQLRISYAGAPSPFIEGLESR